MIPSKQALAIWRAGIKCGLWQYAHWKDGIQFVGTCGHTLKEARKKVDNGKYDAELQTVLNKNAESDPAEQA